MEFKEFTSPETKDYDITNESETTVNKEHNQYTNDLIELIGILEDVNEKELQEKYGISLNEYYNPTEETIIKVSNKLESNKPNMHL